MNTKFISAGLVKIVYAIIAIVTFGHAWLHIMSFPGVALPLEFWYFKAILTLVAAVCWPLYWSIWIWS